MSNLKGLCLCVWLSLIINIKSSLKEQYNIVVNLSVIYWSELKHCIGDKLSLCSHGHHDNSMKHNLITHYRRTATILIGFPIIKSIRNMIYIFLLHRNSQTLTDGKADNWSLINCKASRSYHQGKWEIRDVVNMIYPWNRLSLMSDWTSIFCW